LIAFEAIAVPIITICFKTTRYGLCPKPVSGALFVAVNNVVTQGGGPGLEAGANN
jgi:hypothetical protein